MKKDYIYNLLAILYLILPPTLYVIINYFIVRYFNNMSVIEVILILLLIFLIATSIYDIEVRLIKIKNELIAAIVSIATLTFVLIFFEI